MRGERFSFHAPSVIDHSATCAGALAAALPRARSALATTSLMMTLERSASPCSVTLYEASSSSMMLSRVAASSPEKK